jgi:hypothetical protein
MWESHASLEDPLVTLLRQCVDDEDVAGQFEAGEFFGPNGDQLGASIVMPTLIFTITPGSAAPIGDSFGHAA